MPAQKRPSPGYSLQVRTRSFLPRLRAFRCYPFRACPEPSRRAGATEGDLVYKIRVTSSHQGYNRDTMVSSDISISSLRSGPVCSGAKSY